MHLLERENVERLKWMKARMELLLAPVARAFMHGS
jgi:hypothetical protein